MTQNVGARDGQVRTAFGVIALFVTGILVAYAQAAWWSLALIAVAIVVLLSGTLRSCPLYTLFGHSTSR